MDLHGSVFFALLVAVGGQNPCPDGFFHAGNKCYITSNDPVNWFQAQDVS